LSVAAKPVAMTAESPSPRRLIGRRRRPAARRSARARRCRGRRLGENWRCSQASERRRKDRHDEGVGNQKAEQPIFTQELAVANARRAVRRQLAGDRLVTSASPSRRESRPP
jgi:hypothetical protein